MTGMEYEETVKKWKLREKVGGFHFLFSANCAILFNGVLSKPILCARPPRRAPDFDRRRKGRRRQAVGTKKHLLPVHRVHGREHDRRIRLLYEDEFELTFDLQNEEPQPEQAAQEPPVPPKPKAAAPVVDEPTRVMVLEKPQPVPQPEMPEPVQEEPEKTPAPTVQAAANGRCVLISGGDRGIGAAAARAFYAAGYRVAVLYHSNAKAAAELEKQLPGITAVQCDVASRASCELAFRTAEQALGRVDVLVSNAGIAQQKLFTDITPEEWQHMLDVNLTGAFHLCQLALPGMIRRKAGRILTVSSMWGQTGGSCEVHYSAAKAGLIGLTKALAKEEGPSGITVNCVAPGVIDTDMMAAFTAEDKAALAEETPVGRLGSADEVAQLLVFLAGEGAGYITGQVFGVNGGLVI